MGLTREQARAAREKIRAAKERIQVAKSEPPSERVKDQPRDEDGRWTSTGASGSSVKPDQLRRGVEKLKTAAKKEDPMSGDSEADQLPEDHAISISPSHTVRALNKALDDIPTAGAAERVAKLRQFVSNQGTQVVFYDPSASESQQLGIIRGGLNNQKAMKSDGKLKAYATVSAVGQGGGTFPQVNHVVVAIGQHGKKDFQLSKDEIRKISDEVFFANDDGEPNWGLGSHRKSDSSQSELSCYLHEMGHQVHFCIDEAKPPASVTAMTKYGAVSTEEWFAEHFALWMLDADEYRKYDPEGADFIERSFDKALKAPKRLK